MARPGKLEALGSAATPLHANELGRLRSVIAPAIGSFFHERIFGRVGVFSTDATTVSENSPSPWLLAGLVMHSVGDVVRAIHLRPPQICVILESSERLERALSFHLGGYRLRSQDGDYDVKPRILLLAKSAGEAGLEVADFILHAGGGNVREWLRTGANPQRKDFKAVFEPEHVSHEYVKYIDLLSASG